ncbi:MAG: DUF488 domain-containing protein [Candidatus Thermoplasmatota archaeon]|jgi:uncharacterized protein (DUF488 family)|nr:DUF488 domain-containing protein [Candidatus Thermoplasmatota archaeon]
MIANNERGIVTIGYEGKNIDGVIRELSENKIHVLVDVRNNPFSRKKGFSKSRLTDHLKEAGIEYVHIPELGIESKRKKNLHTDEDYRRLFKEYSDDLQTKENHLDRIKTMSDENKIVQMCFEKNPDYCHRGVIAERLREVGMEVVDV